ncbi:MAG: DUF423 domain-containing protein [Parvularculaceae bacterium]
MRAIWVIGVMHALIGGGVLFMTLHPLQDALDPHALDLVKVASVWQALQGLTLMLVAAVTSARWQGALIAAGTTMACAMLYFVIFTGLRPPVIVISPIGGAISWLGWVGLLFARPQK